MSMIEKISFPASPIQRVMHPKSKAKGIALWIKRDDLLFPLEAPDFNGNKMRKMKYNLLEAEKQEASTLLTFGGVFSNHIAATAAAGKYLDLKTIGVIRGEWPEGGNPTLNAAIANGMQLHFVSRTDYRKKRTLGFIEDLKQQFGRFYLIPEGGSNELALPGCAEVVDEIMMQLEDTPDFIVSASGTGGTIAGIIRGLEKFPETKTLSFPALKGDFMKGEIEAFYTGINKNWDIISEYHFGGFARHKPELIAFMNEFYAETGIKTESLYTGKMLYGIFDLIDKGYFPKGSKIVAIHTGGLQGLRGFQHRFGRLLNY